MFNKIFDIFFPVLTCCYVYFGMPIYLMSFFNKKISEKFSQTWVFLGLLIAKIFAVNNIIIHYDPNILKYKKILLISNHVNHLDGLVLWASLLSIGKKSICFFVKRSLIKLFPLSITMKMLNFVFLERNITIDCIKLMQACEDLSKKDQYTAILFPEGTLKMQSKSDYLNLNRALNRKLKSFKNVIIPKTTGFDILIKNLNFDGVVDCTLHYSQPNMSYFDLIFRTSCRTDVEIYLKEVKVPDDPVNWLIDHYSKKDKLIENKFQDEEYTSLHTFKLNTERIKYNALKTSLFLKI